MFNYNGYKVFLACGTTDMRKNINELCDIVQHNFDLDPIQLNKELPISEILPWSLNIPERCKNTDTPQS